MNAPLRPNFACSNTHVIHHQGEAKKQSKAYPGKQNSEAGGMPFGVISQLQ